MSVCVICPEGASLFVYKKKLLVDRISMDESLLKRGDIAEAYNGALKNYKSRENLRADGVFLLPQNMYGVDYVVIPSIGKSRRDGLLRTEIKARHKNYGELAVSYCLLKTDKTSVTYRLILTRKSVLEQIRSAFFNVNIRITAFIPAGVAAIEGAALLNPDIKSGSDILFMADDNKGFLAECVNGILIGDGKIDFGTDALSDEKVTVAMPYGRSDSARRIVENAYGQIDDSAATAGETDFFGNGGKAYAPSFSDESSENITRPAPENQSDFVTENFRLFERRILMAARELKYGENAINITKIYLYMPPRFDFLAERMSMENPSYKWINVNGKEYGEISDISELMIDGAETEFLKIRPLSALRRKLAAEPITPPVENNRAARSGKVKKSEAELSTLPYFRV